MRSTPFIVAIALLSLSLRPGRASADGDVAAPACVPTDLTLMQGLYDSAGNSYAFFADELGAFTVTCPVTLANGDYRLYLSYLNDYDGSSEGAFYVRAQWKRRNRSTGVVSTLCDDYSSLTSAATSPMCQTTSHIDNVGYLYFVDVTLFRAATQAASIRFNGIAFVKQ